MAKILVVDDEPVLCDLFRGWLHDDLGAEVTCSLTGTIAAQMMVGSYFDLALIDAALPDSSSVALAELAANRNTPALLTSGHPDLIDRLGECGFPVLPKPFKAGRLLAEAASIMAHAAENIDRVKASAAELRRRTQALQGVIEESRRLVAAMAPPIGC